MTLSAVETLAVALLILQLGELLRRRVSFLKNFNLPAPVVGGLLAAAVLALLVSLGAPRINFDGGLQRGLMIAFFTSIGFSASLTLVRQGGRTVIVLLALATGVAILQALLGAGIAIGFGLPPLLGVLTGTATLSGGPATGLAFAPLFEARGVAGAAPIALASGMAGIVLAGLLAAPLATGLMRRHCIALPKAGVSPGLSDSKIVLPPLPEADTLLAALAALAVAMALGSWVSGWVEGLGITLPPYVGAMIVACVLRNLHDHIPVVRIAVAPIELLGTIALSLFLTMAMMSLDLALLAGLAVPLLVGLLAQVLLLVALLRFVWWALGRDYDAAVATAGFVGFMLGITAAALAAMRALQERFGPAPRAFLGVPIVGAFLIDFVNAVIITVALNL